MIILISILPEERPASGNSAELAGKLFRMAADAYAIHTGGNGSLASPDPSVPMDESVRLLDGKAEPEAVVNAAKLWNTGLAADFQSAFSEAENSWKRHDGCWLSVPAPVLRDLEKAAMALDDGVHRFARKALLVGSRKGLSARLSDAELKDVWTNPGNYALIEVTPK